MPINMSCPSCGKVLAAPTRPPASGPSAPAAQIMIVPASPVQPQPVPPAPPPNSYAPQPPALAGEDWLSGLGGAAQSPSAATAPPGSEARQPCPECGEMIVVGAAKCRFCGTIFDPRLRGRSYRSVSAAFGPPKMRAKQIRQYFTTWWVCLAAGGGVIAVFASVAFAAQNRPDLVGSAVAGALLGAGVMFVGWVFYLMLLYKLWCVVQDGRAQTTPGQAVGFLFIPCFNIYWQFVSFWGLAKDLNRVSREYMLGAAGE